MSQENARFKLRADEPSTERIAALAYSLFEAGGRLDGHDLEHWLRAKKQLSTGYSSENNSQRREAQQQAA